jgi:hypothetical protein
MFASEKQRRGYFGNNQSGYPVLENESEKHKQQRLESMKKIQQQKIKLQNELNENQHISRSVVRSLYDDPRSPDWSKEYAVKKRLEDAKERESSKRFFKQHFGNDDHVKHHNEPTEICCDCGKEIPLSKLKDHPVMCR